MFCKSSAGIKQACLIAKAQHFEGFPPAIEGLIGAVDIADKVSAKIQVYKVFTFSVLFNR